ALVAGTVVVVSMTATPKVQAATILNSLRNEPIHGVSISMDVTSDDGVRVNGSVELTFKEPLTPAQLFPPEDAEPGLSPTPEPSSMALDLNVTPAGGNGGAQAFSATVRGAIGGDSDWVYVRATALPPEANTELGALSAIVGGMLRQGVLLDLGENGFEQFMTGPVDLDPGMFEGMGEFEVNGAIPELPEGASITFEPSVSITAGPGAGGNAGAASGPEHDRFMGLVKPLLSGQATRGQLEQLVNLAQGEGTSSVQDLGNGQYLLTTTMPPIAPDGVATTMSISYQEGAGVRWVEVVINDDGTHGTVRVAPLSGAIDPARLNKARATGAGDPVPMTLNGPALMQLFGGGAGGGPAGGQ
ncbi:MAG: hypothetical protein K2X32_04910, partial [Phycisphaerales bacterium]|nr:hypothetical protein [Phycisphaerales bacterium]